MAQRGRPKKVVTNDEEIITVVNSIPEASGLRPGVGSFSQGKEFGFDRDLFNASAVIAGAMAAGQGGWAPVISKTAVKVAKELLEIVKEG